MSSVSDDLRGIFVQCRPKLFITQPEALDANQASRYLLLMGVCRKLITFFASCCASEKLVQEDVGYELEYLSVFL